MKDISLPLPCHPTRPLLPSGPLCPKLPVSSCLGEWTCPWWEWGRGKKICDISSAGRATRKLHCLLSKGLVGAHPSPAPSPLQANRVHVVRRPLPCQDVPAPSPGTEAGVVGGSGGGGQGCSIKGPLCCWRGEKPLTGRRGTARRPCSLPERLGYSRGTEVRPEN